MKKEKIKRKQEEKIPENKLDPAARKAQQEVKVIELCALSFTH